MLHRDGEAVLVLGNENLKLAGHARLENRVIHAPWFRCPISRWKPVKRWLSGFRRQALRRKTRIGLAGWKLLLARRMTARRCSICLPLSWTLFARPPARRQDLTNATGIFIDPASGRESPIMPTSWRTMSTAQIWLPPRFSPRLTPLRRVKRKSKSARCWRRKGSLIAW